MLVVHIISIIAMIAATATTTIPMIAVIAFLHSACFIDAIASVRLIFCQCGDADHSDDPRRPPQHHYNYRGDR